MKNKSISLDELLTKGNCTPAPFFTVHGKGTCFHDGNTDSIQKETGEDGAEVVIETVCEFWPAAREIAKNDALLFNHFRNYGEDMVAEFENVLNRATEGLEQIDSGDLTGVTMNLQELQKEMKTMLKKVKTVKIS